MKRDEPENLDLLAAEYVIGTLRAGARRSFERRQRRDPFVARRVSAWEERFAQLSLRLVPIAPSPEVWAAIERHAWRTFVSERSTPARSSSSPRIKAILSPFSRSRVMTYRYSASAWFLFSDACTNLLPIRTMEPLATSA